MSKKRTGQNNKKKVVYSDEPSKKDIINICRNTEDIDVILKYTYSEDDDIRLEACK